MTINEILLLILSHLNYVVPLNNCVISVLFIYLDSIIL